MLLPENEDLAIPVRLMCPTLAVPLMLDATVRRYDGSEIAVEVDTSKLAVGMRVVVDGGASSQLRAMGEVTRVDAAGVSVRTKGRMSADQREFPRALGTMRVWYRPIGADEVATLSAWVRGGEGISDDTDVWLPVPPVVDFSASGIRFLIRGAPPASARVAVRFRLPGETEARRATASVVRAEPVRDDQRGSALLERDDRRPTHSLAVQFIDVLAESAEALAEYSLRLQESELDEES